MAHRQTWQALIYVSKAHFEGAKYLRLMTMGTRDMRTASSTDGNSPLITPIITFGILVSHESHVKFSR